MEIHLSEEEESVREWAKRFAEDVVKPELPRHQTDKLSPSFLSRLSEEGFMTLLVPEALGGGGLDPVAFSVALKEISKVCGSTGVTLAVTNMLADVLVREGSDFQKDFFLKQLINGSSPTASFCLTENAAGSDARALQSRATRAGSKYILNGEKIYVTNGAFSQFFLVMAKTEGDRISAFLVPRDSKGLVIGKEEDKMGLTGSSTIRMSFEDVELSEEHRVLNEGDGFKIAMRALDGGRISVATQALGIAEASLREGVKYSKEREQFGKSISEFQAIQWKLADSATKLSAAELLIFRAADLKRRNRPFTREASMAKLFATESAIQVCDEMIQVHGGYGYIKEYPVERYYRDVRVTSLYEGTSEIQRLVISRDLLTKESL